MHGQCLNNPNTQLRKTLLLGYIAYLNIVTDEYLPAFFLSDFIL